MARKTARPGRTLRCVLPRAGDRLRAGGSGRHLEARARPRPPGRHQHPADRQGQPERRVASTRPARSSTSASTAHGVSEAEVTVQGNRYHRRRDPRREPPRPRRDREAPGPAAVPHRGLLRRQPGRLRQRRRRDAAGPDPARARPRAPASRRATPTPAPTDAATDAPTDAPPSDSAAPSDAAADTAAPSGTANRAPAHYADETGPRRRPRPTTPAAEREPDRQPTDGSPTARRATERPPTSGPGHPSLPRAAPTSPTR